MTLRGVRLSERAQASIDLDHLLQPSPECRPLGREPVKPWQRPLDEGGQNRRRGAGPWYGVRWQFGWQGNAVASVSAQRVFLEIGKIARADLPLRKRLAEGAKRINQFKADLAIARIQPREAAMLKENLRRTLQRGATKHDLTMEQNSVYAEALDVLMGQGR
jgi:hypothetical protein